ncbi:DUF2569 domain-containing protein [Sphingomonas sp. LaA6.9]|uniref:DUF2569 domain-containing protein n=1 Tax=Sphingomonas sp. LaA6.9 TaxID=2919914 RepID=UPI001F4F9DD0|nr:DUF2569 domain-containing protein [Sphingomonas sp. LaA6.9]MCJ8159285.1 DUF2569 domain-containing protein [Sphingomonas sp. LaA6.9]
MNAFPLATRLGAASDRLHARSRALVRHLNADMQRIVLVWVVLASFGCGLRIAGATARGADALSGLMTALPYAFVIGAPIISLFLALRWFPAGGLLAQPKLRLARFGRWRDVDCVAARTLPLYGATGWMASLLLGILINIPVRTLEFLTAIPALGAHAPQWFVGLYALTMADVVVMTSLYAIAFVMALRHVPWFPRFLLMVWGFDLAAQLLIADLMAATPGLPASVARALGALLEGNLQKTLISMSLWLPYLLLSRRVNLTYRSRVPG